MTDDSKLLEILQRYSEHFAASKREPQSGQTSVDNLQLHEEMCAALESDEELSRHFGRKIRTGFHECTEFGAEWLDYAISTQLIRGRSPTEIIKGLREHLVKTSISGTEITTLFGIEIDQPIQLSKHVGLVRADDLPRAGFRDILMSPSDQYEPPFLGLDRTKPRTAIAINWISPGLFVDEDEHTNRTQELSMMALIVSQVIGSLVVNGYKITRGHQFSISKDLDPLAFADGFSYVGAGMPINSSPPTKVRDDSHEALRETFESLERFPNYSDLHRLLERLNRARMASDPVDAHLDLGIIAESLLTHGDKAESEVGHRIATRGAWLLGSTREKRTEVSRRIKQLYGHRSTAAHQGRLRAKKEGGSKPWAPGDRVDAEELCTELLLETIRRNAFVKQSEWPSIVFG